jgi:5'-3' exonuclease
MNAGYKEETVKSLKEGMDEKFMEGKDAKGVWDTDPKDLHKKVREHQIDNEGVTSENLKDFKEKDKEKLERLAGYLDDLIDHKLATEEQITFRKQLSSHIASLTKTEGGDKTQEGGDKTQEGGDKTQEGGDKTQEGGDNKEKTPSQEDKKSWYK